jgi:hypothetical protein
MRHKTKSWLAGFGVVLAAAVLTTPASAAPAAAPVIHPTVFATQAGTLYRLTLSSTGAVTARTPVAGGAGAVASDYDGNRLVFVRQGAPDWRDDQVWVREASGVSRFLAMGHLGTISPGRTGVTIARYVAATPARWTRSTTSSPRTASPTGTSSRCPRTATGGPTSGCGTRGTARRCG